jgi:hypothetical protein
VRTFAQAAEWHQVEYHRDEHKNLLVVPVRCSTGECLCKRCGTSIDSFLEHDRKKCVSLMKAGDSAFKEDFQTTLDVQELGADRNPFNRRGVFSSNYVGFEVPFPVFFAQVEALEKKYDMTIEQMGLEFETMNNARGEPAIRLVVVDPSEEIGEGIAIVEGKMYFRSETAIRETVLSPHEQLREDHASRAWKYTAAQADDKRKQLTCKNVVASCAGRASGLLTWSKIHSKIMKEKEKLKVKEGELVSRAGDGATESSGGSRAVLVRGNVRDVQVDKADPKKKGRGTPRVSSGRGGGGRGRGEDRNAVKGRKAASAEAAKKSSVVQCSSAEESGDDVGSVSSKAKASSAYAHKLPKLLEYFKGAKPGAITIPVAAYLRAVR